MTGNIPTKDDYAIFSKYPHVIVSEKPCPAFVAHWLKFATSITNKKQVCDRNIPTKDDYVIFSKCPHVIVSEKQCPAFCRALVEVCNFNHK